MRRKMERKRLIEYIGDKVNFDAEDYISPEILDNDSRIDDIIEWLNELKSKGAFHIKWKGISFDGVSSSVEAQGVFVRDETDEEYTERQERATYEKLKNKFES